MMEHAEHSPAAIREKAAGAVNCQSVTLPSGLTVLCRTMPGYSSVHAMYATNFGSVVREFTLNGKRIQLPAGTAHFLEHKMFESEQGDAFDLYAKTGAAANAFTSYDRTCYIFTATGMTDENLDILLNMVGHPWFTKETIAKEQGIIGQEIKMYDDSPDWRLLTALFRCLYKSHPIPLRDDIAGTVESIAELTPELLYACTDAFYRPGNMVLSVAGNITLDQAVEACRRNGVYDAVEPPQVETIFPQEKAGEFFNPKFVCVKFDMEKGEGPELDKKFGVRAYPTFLILRPDGSVQHKVVGGGDLEGFIARVEKGLNEKTSLDYLNKLYEKGKMNKKQLMAYQIALNDAYEQAKS